MEISLDLRPPYHEHD